jgi:hypothetical protein
MKNSIEKYFWQLLTIISALAGFIVYVNKREYTNMLTQLKKAEQRVEVERQENKKQHEFFINEFNSIKTDLEQERRQKDSLFKILTIEQTLNKFKK